MEYIYIANPYNRWHDPCKQKFFKSTKLSIRACWEYIRPWCIHRTSSELCTGCTGCGYVYELYANFSGLCNH